MIEALIASCGIASLSLIGVFVFGKEKKIEGTHRFILPIAVGVFLGIVFFELVPETLEGSPAWGPLAIMGGFLGFYLLSHFLDTFHHHHTNHDDSCVNNGARMLLIGDTIHNFADGVVVASAFIINPITGVLTTIGIALHEIPQEIVEFGVLMQSGCTRSKAALYNFISALSIILGVFATYVFITSLNEYMFALTGIAAGNLLYIATADLIPELRTSHKDHFFTTFIATVLGVLAVAGLVSFTHGIL